MENQVAITKNTMSLTRVLREIKSLDEQITSFLEQPDNVMVSVVQGQEKRTMYAGLDAVQLEKKIQSNHDKLAAMIERRFILKRKLITANATTMITINDKQYSIAEAIELKKLIPVKESIIKGLKKQLSRCQQLVDKNTEELSKGVTELAKNVINDSNDVESRKATLEMLSKGIEDKNKVHFLDPKGIAKIIEKHQQEVDEIKNELDYRLSEINTLTVIEV